MTGLDLARKLREAPDPFRAESKLMWAGIVWTILITLALIAVVLGPTDLKQFKSGLPAAPSPWAAVTISGLALLAGTTSAIFAGLNYSRANKARATIVVERFEDNQGKIILGPSDVRNFHQLRMWVSNTGQAPAKIRSVIVNPEIVASPMSIDREVNRMSALAQMSAVATNSSSTDISAGQKAYFPSFAGFPDDTWADFLSRKQLLYVFGRVSFVDELSGDSEVVTEICIRLDPTLNTWGHCASGRNQTLR